MAGPEPIAAIEDHDAIVHLAESEPMGPQGGYQNNLQAAKELARHDPKVVANVVKGWVGGSNE